MKAEHLAEATKLVAAMQANRQRLEELQKAKAIRFCFGTREISIDPSNDNYNDMREHITVLIELELANGLVRAAQLGLTF